MSTVVFMLTGEASFARVAEAAETGWTATCLRISAHGGQRFSLKADTISS